MLFMQFLQKLLGSQGFIEKGESYDAIRAILGDGLLLAAGENIILCNVKNK